MNAFVLDTSALLAIYFRELTAEWVRQQIAQTPRLLMSTVNLAETLLRFRETQPTEADNLEARLLASDIEWITADTAQAVVVAKARLLYPLNFGDCFAYALAKTQNLPLLTLDRDFRSTDITVILPPQS
jgi:ribonuclease VapC